MRLRYPRAEPTRTIDGDVLDANQTLDAARRLARRTLGVESERALTDPAVQALLLRRLRGGDALDDAVFATLHARARDNRLLASELLAPFLLELGSVARRALTPKLRRFLDSGDLVQSVLGEAWHELFQLEFETRGQFLAYVSRRLRWKALDRNKRIGAIRRSEDRRSPLSPDELGLADERWSPADAAEAGEERARLALVLARLSERDRQVLRMELSGCSVGEIARVLGTSPDTARKAVARAVIRARDLAGPADTQG